ncbi:MULTISPECIES: hypothetical protein [Streptomyces]|uniref:hypothetical protein n=1 Tax=Streptomyces TaxID=1883 RepID=UPI0004C81796|nr:MULTISPECIES: hypothetical protein [Streptomyces]
MLGVAVLGALVDCTGMANASAHSDDLAVEAARAGAQQIDPTKAIPGEAIVTDPDAAAQAARAYLSQAGLEGTVHVNEQGTKVSVTIHDSYRCRMLSAFGISTIDYTVTGRASLVHKAGD